MKEKTVNAIVTDCDGKVKEILHNISMEEYNELRTKYYNSSKTVRLLMNYTIAIVKANVLCTKKFFIENYEVGDALNIEPVIIKLYNNDELKIAIDELNDCSNSIIQNVDDVSIVEYGLMFLHNGNKYLYVENEYN